MSLLGFAWGFLFGWLMDLWFWLAFYTPLTAKSLLVVVGLSLPFDAAGAVGNFAFFWVFGERVLGSLGRFRDRFQIVQNRRLESTPLSGSDRTVDPTPQN